MSFEQGFMAASAKTEQVISTRLSTLELDLRAKDAEYLAHLAEEILQKSQQEIETEVRAALRDGERGVQWLQNRRDAKIISAMIDETRQKIALEVIVPALNTIQQLQIQEKLIRVNTQTALQGLRAKVDAVFLANLENFASPEQVERVKMQTLQGRIEDIRATVPPEQQLEALQGLIDPEFTGFILPIEAEIKAKKIRFTDSRPGIIVDFFNAPSDASTREKLMDFKTLQYLNDYIETAPQRFQRYQQSLRRLSRGKTPQDREQKARSMRYIFADYALMNIALEAKKKIFADPALKQAYELANTSGRIPEQVRVYLDEGSAEKNGPLRELLKKPDGILRFMAFGVGTAWLWLTFFANGITFASNMKHNKEAGMFAGAAGALAYNMPRLKAAVSGGDRAESFYDVFLQRFDESAAAGVRKFFLESDPAHVEAELTDLVNWKRLRETDFRVDKTSRGEWGLAELMKIGENPLIVSSGVNKQKFDQILAQMRSQPDHYFSAERNKDRKEVYKEFLGEFTTHEMRHFQEYLREKRA